MLSDCHWPFFASASRKEHFEYTLDAKATFSLGAAFEISSLNIAFYQISFILMLVGRWAKGIVVGHKWWGLYKIRPKSPNYAYLIGQFTYEPKRLDFTKLHYHKHFVSEFTQHSQCCMYPLLSFARDPK